jgi:hypothetical protein
LLSARAVEPSAPASSPKSKNKMEEATWNWETVATDQSIKDQLSDVFASIWLVGAGALSEFVIEGSDSKSIVVTQENALLIDQLLCRAVNELDLESHGPHEFDIALRAGMAVQSLHEQEIYGRS